MNAPEIEFADAGWVAITRNEGGHVGVKPVRMFELTAEGVTPLTKNADGAMVPDPDVIEVIKTDPLHAVKLAAMHKLVDVAGRCTTDEARADLRRIAKWLADWEPGDPGLRLADDAEA
ncbi:hypothetical protein [Streptomyces sudanensis]|uniref:hypothetical protein n=1 Tax=Streptomyces sudanensis TaxID=436397 RepID=UPI0020CE9392|nr:hypothetical protein [Streptomyces sudanensis]MCP9957087.1 hypothetical protein [Streptomyces sudanensis]MCQ0002332.1 hypothetical protein [Streptomyces sudanensis]